MKKYILIFIAGLLFTLNLQAQDQAVGSDKPIRKGFTIGASAGIGVLHFTEGMDDKSTQGDISLPNLKMGWFLNERTAIYLNSVGQIYQDNGKDRSFEGIIPTVQYWASPKWWIGGGYGAALDTKVLYKNGDSRKTNWGRGVIVSTGYEVLQRSKWALDIQSRLFMGHVDLDEGGKLEGTNFTLGVGITLF